MEKNAQKKNEMSAEFDVSQDKMELILHQAMAMFANNSNKPSIKQKDGDAQQKQQEIQGQQQHADMFPFMGIGMDKVKNIACIAIGGVVGLSALVGGLSAVLVSKTFG